MDRVIIYPGAIPLETDLLSSEKNTMIAMAKLSAAAFGVNTIANGLSCIPTGPASLQVWVNPGEIYSLQNIDNTAFSSLLADTAHQIVKQGISLNQLTLSCPAPATSGQSINYLIQAAYQDTDALPVVLPYYNASNPATAYSGPANMGSANNTVRQGNCAVTVKTGTAATTGSQVTPATDTGYIPLWVVTVANGQATIVAANIVAASTQSLLPGSLLASIQGGLANSASDTGVVNAYVATFLPAIPAPVPGAPLWIKIKTANTSASTINLTGTAYPLLGGAHSALQGGEMIANGWALIVWNATLTSWVLLECTGAASQLAAGSYGVAPWASDNSTKLATTNWFYSAIATVATAAGFAANLTTNGYIKLPSWLSGLVIQWGLVVASTGGTVVPFPMTYPSSVFVVASGKGINNAVLVSTYGYSTTGFTMALSATDANSQPWISFGK